MLTREARGLGGDAAVLRRYGFMLLLSSVLLMAGRCSAQEEGSQPGGPDSGTKQDAPEPCGQQGQKPDTSANDQGGSQPTDQGGSRSTEGGTVAKMEAGVNRVMNLPAEWFLGAYVPSDRNLQPLNYQERGQVYVRQTYLTGASYLKRLFAAGVDQARGVPSQWGGGFAAYGERFGSRYGQFIIQNTLTSAGDAALGYEPRYDLCRCLGFWPRTRHAMLRNFVTYNSTEIEKKPQIPLYLAAFSAGALATTWKPGSQSPWRSGAYGVLAQAGVGAISNWLQEFALDLGRKLSRNKGAKDMGGVQP
jgi:hypothetical protein